MVSKKDCEKFKKLWEDLAEAIKVDNIKIPVPKAKTMPYNWVMPLEPMPPVKIIYPEKPLFDYHYFPKKKAKQKVPAKKTPKTQKAKGILRGIHYLMGQYKDGLQMMRTYMQEPTHKLIQTQQDINRFGKQKLYYWYAPPAQTYPAFARPCPVKPRHGFVDSRLVKNKTELTKLFKEVKKYDKRGEIILGPHVNKVEYNAVYVNTGSLSVGKGNDGATAGKGSISYPVAPQKFKEDLIKLSGLKKSDTVYLESIRAKGSCYWLLTQIRGGPKIDSAALDFIPKKTTVKEIVAPCDDLLAWEKQVAKFKPGTVVYAKGHTLASHAAIHCVLHKVPFITTKKPKIGSTLIPTQKRTTKRISRKQFRIGVRAGIEYAKKFQYYDVQSHMRQMFYYSLSVLHNWAYLKQSEHASWMLGAASVIFCKLGTALALGELRHKPRVHGGCPEHDRCYIYRNVLEDNTAMFSKLSGAYKDFYQESWPQAFGGLPWATCTWYTYCLWKQVVSSYNRKSSSLSDKEETDLISIINKATNVAHNGGWWFDKFAKKADMDFAANYPGLIAFVSVGTFEDIRNRAKRIKTTTQRMRAPARIKSPCVDVNGNLGWVCATQPGAYTKVSLHIENGDKKPKIIKKRIKLEPKDVAALKKKFKQMKKTLDSKMVVPVENGLFKIGKQERIVRKVFKVA